MNLVTASQRFAAGGARRASQSLAATPLSGNSTPSGLSPSADGKPRSSISSVEDDGFHTAEEEDEEREAQRDRELESRRHEREKGEGQGEAHGSAEERDRRREAMMEKVSEGVAELEL